MDRQQFFNNKDYSVFLNSKIQDLYDDNYHFFEKLLIGNLKGILEDIIIKICGFKNIH